MTETEKLRELVARLDAYGGPHPSGSYEVWRVGRAELVARISAQALFALEEQLASGSSLEPKIDRLTMRVEQIGKIASDLAKVVVKIGRAL